MSGFQRAERKKVKIKIGIAAPSGAGKTYSALLIARGLATKPDGTIGKIALVDTENDSASLYAGSAGIPEFDTLPLKPPYLTKKYVEAIALAAKEGYEVLVIDSGSHQWQGEGGIMDRMDKEKLANPKLNSYTLWAKFTPEHELFKSTIVNAPIHIIITLRAKQEYVLDKDEKGRTTPRKTGMAPVQRDQFEYELSCVFDMSMEHYATVSKDRTGLFDGSCFQPSVGTGTTLLEWLATGKEPAPIPAASVEPAQPRTGPAIVKPNPRVAELQSAIRPELWPEGTVGAYCKAAFGTMKVGELSDDQFQQLLWVIRNHGPQIAHANLKAAQDLGPVIGNAPPEAATGEQGSFDQFDEPGTAG